MSDTVTQIAHAANSSARPISLAAHFQIRVPPPFGKIIHFEILKTAVFKPLQHILIRLTAEGLKMYTREIMFR